jgi:hypothetical protein
MIVGHDQTGDDNANETRRDQICPGQDYPTLLAESCVVPRRTSIASRVLGGVERSTGGVDRVWWGTCRELTRPH